jgi:hypothetical protein
MGPFSGRLGFANETPQSGVKSPSDRSGQADNRKLWRCEMTGKLLADGLMFGLNAIQVWTEFNANLLALQEKRAAEGKVLTLEDVSNLLEKTGNKIEANGGVLLKAWLAQQASMTA